MAKVSIESLTKRFPARPPTVAIDDVSLEIGDGEFVVLLGPSGCGKTTILRCLSGLETPDTGRITFGGTPVFDHQRRINVVPNRRSIGMVFQSYALWPHMSVRKNIAYPLRARHLKGAIADGWVDEVAAVVQCEDVLERSVGQLSGGQQQRVALARGIVARPDLILFDEPLSNLDARLRDRLRLQLHELHGRLHFSAVFVTHDQREAFALADRLVLLRDGRIEQHGDPREVCDRPQTEYVAGFIGMTNRLELNLRHGQWFIGDTALRGERMPTNLADKQVAIRLRPRHMRVAPLASEARPNEVDLQGSFVDSTFDGEHLTVVVEVSGQRMEGLAELDGRRSWVDDLSPGQPVAVRYDPDNARSFGLASSQQPRPGAITVEQPAADQPADAASGASSSGATR